MIAMRLSRNTAILWSLLTILSVSLFGCAEDTVHRGEVSIVPKPLSVKMKTDSIFLSGNFVVEDDNRSLHYFKTLINNFFPVSPGPSNNIESSPTGITFEYQSSMSSEAYVLEIGNTIKVSAANERGMAYGLISLAQLRSDKGYVPKGIISDVPAYDYRALMIDLSRNWHSVENLKQLISLCSWYKIKYLQLHLTDDGLFTFPSTAFPELSSEQHYTLEEIEDLNAFAKAHAVILVPEIDMPGHASGFIRANPKQWGLEAANSNSYTLHMGRESVYNNIRVLLNEVAVAFPESPFIHIGGDEVYLGGFSEDAETKAYKEKHGLTTDIDLYHHFIVRIAGQVKDVGKQPIIWTGFEHNSSVQIPKDILIMSWNLSTYTPKELVAEGYQLINASWKPLYVVNNRKWSPEHIYNWTPYQWKGDQTPDELPGHRIDSTGSVLGASMSAWEQNQYKELPTLRKRLAAMSERLWNPNQSTYSSYESRAAVVNTRFSEVLFPFKVTVEGLIFTGWEEANFSENYWFGDTLHIEVKNFGKGSLRYTIDGSVPSLESPKLIAPILLDNTAVVSIQAFDKGGIPKGHLWSQRYILAPIQVKTKGLVNDLKPHSWENHKFRDTLFLKIATKREGDIYFTLDGHAPGVRDMVYENEISVTQSCILRAQVFGKDREPIGAPFSEEYVKLGIERSLTTGKPVTTSNGEDEMGEPGIINDTEIARWDHWGAHTDGNNWVVVDLENIHMLNRFKTYTFWDGSRFYEYGIDVSMNGVDWTQVVDRSTNREIATEKGIEDLITPVQARYVRLRLIRNSANPGLHLVEFQAFEAE
jgi:hexosaminidase